MAWKHDRLSPVDTLLFRSELAKVGRFQCDVDNPCFAVTESLDNDVFVLPRNPLWLRRSGGDYRFVEPGGILLHRAGCVLERRSVRNIGDNAYWFGVHPEIFLESLQRYALSTDEMGSALIANPKLRYRLVLLANRIEQGHVEKLAVEEEVLNIFFEICEQRAGRMGRYRRTRRKTALRRRRLSDMARAHLDAHLGESISLDAVSRAVGTSVYHLCRVFKEQTGLTLHAYRTRQRLGSVVDRIVSDSPADLTDLAFEFGFSSHSHLSRLFRRHMDLSPSSLRLSVASNR